MLLSEPKLTKVQNNKKKIYRIFCGRKELRKKNRKPETQVKLGYARTENVNRILKNAFPFDLIKIEIRNAIFICFFLNKSYIALII